MELFSATGAVIAIMAGELFVGSAEGHLNGAGTLGVRDMPGTGCVFTISLPRHQVPVSSPG